MDYLGLGLVFDCEESTENVVGFVVAVVVVSGGVNVRGELV